MAEQRITFRGFKFNRRTADMFLEVERLLGYKLVITQGSYNSSVAASGGTHNGGGAVDVRARDLNDRQRHDVVLNMRRVGFAAWLRTPDQGNWPYHFHGIAVGDDDLSPAAAKQVVDYRQGRNGLANNGPDDGPSGYRLMTWEYYQYLLQANGNDVTPEQMNTLTTAINRAVAQAVSATTVALADKEIDARTERIAQAIEALITRWRLETGTQWTAEIARDVAELTKVGDVSAAVTELAKKVDDLTVKVDALPKA